MQAGSHFTIANRDKISFDDETFAKLYLPILGKTAFTLYHLLRQTSDGKISDLLEYLNVGLYAFETALEKLSALSLVAIYDQMPDYQFGLRSPQPYELFMKDDFYRHLLSARIGPKKVETLQPLQLAGKNVSKKFSEVFPLLVQEGETAAPAFARDKEKLDLESFERMMARQGLHYSSADADVLHLYALAEKFSLDWYGLFKLAEATASADRSLNTHGMAQRLASDSQAQPELPSAYQDLIRQVKAAPSPQDFLEQTKRVLGGYVTSDERRLLTNLAEQKMAAEVQNVLIHYVLVQQGSASLTRKLVDPIANTWLRAQVDTAEKAIAKIIDWSQQRGKKKSATKVDRKTVKAAPSWSNANYKNETTEDDLKKLQALQAQALQKIGEPHGSNE